mgnify:CR=1 FL=1
MQTITYHKATLHDTSILVDTRVQFALELSGPKSEDAIANLKEHMTGYFNRAAQDHSCVSFIARCEGRVAGIGSVHFRETPGGFRNPSGKWGYIMNMYTLPEFRRRGICKKHPGTPGRGRQTARGTDL